MTNACSVLLFNDDIGQPSLGDLQAMFDSPKVDKKVEAMKKTIFMLINGQALPQLLMKVIQTVVPQNDHYLQKLLFVYWEVVDKYGPDGKLLPEMILVCNMLLKNLNHANEYIRGCTLRFLARMKESEILEPLVRAVIDNMDHRHSYVRRNAVVCLHNIFRNFEHMVPDAPQHVASFLDKESDLSAKRNAFLMLCNCQQQLAVEWVLSVIDEIPEFGDILQVSILELIRKVCRQQPATKSKYIRCIYTLLTSSSNSVAFEAANTIVSLSAAPTAVRAAASCYTKLLNNYSDNNVKLIVLDRLIALKEKHKPVVSEFLMDILRVLSNPDVDLRRKLLDFAMDLLDARNINDVLGVLKKETIKVQDSNQKNDENLDTYKQLLVQSIHRCVQRFPESANSIFSTVVDLVSDSSLQTATEVAAFVREVMALFPNLRESVLQRLVLQLHEVSFARVSRMLLFILGEFSVEDEELESTMQSLEQILGEVPLFRNNESAEGEEAPPSAAPAAQAKPLVLADGTYASQGASELPKTTTSSDNEESSKSAEAQIKGLKERIKSGDFFVGSSLCTAVTKIALRARRSDSMDVATKNMLEAKAMLMCFGVLRFGETECSTKIDKGNAERIGQCLHVLSAGTEEDISLWLDRSRDVLMKVIEHDKELRNFGKEEKEVAVSFQADDLLQIRQLQGRQATEHADLMDDGEADLMVAIGKSSKEEDFAARVAKTIQVTGVGDPIYAEAYVSVHQYDVVMEIELTNQTNEELRQVTVELATLGDLKVCDRPQPFKLAAKEKRSLRASIKVSSTETGVIYGNVTFIPASLEKRDSCDGMRVVILNDVHVDIMDYMRPATCSDTKFRTMWAEFEWENKISVQTKLGSPLAFIDYMVGSTKMKCLTSFEGVDHETRFLSGNLYAKSVFGEDALVNISVERVSGRVHGYIRIRSKMQGIALGLGDKMTQKMKDC
uniref:Coatomer subunit beta n=1 Tax=Palpitomonas bilix TaxID=652834 RepID=A0A7S3GLN9_9EUKA|mmetsp:Transcript_8814/g.23861  ORF Transcript_8814/g.23861 Transcript_8814/m.23861 type:complete len:954 (+) Transcript_8814:209-3070(+)